MNQLIKIRCINLIPLFFCTNIGLIFTSEQCAISFTYTERHTQSSKTRFQHVIGDVSSAPASWPSPQADASTPPPHSLTPVLLPRLAATPFASPALASSPSPTIPLRLFLGVVPRPSNGVNTTSHLLLLWVRVIRGVLIRRRWSKESFLPRVLAMEMVAG
jgi:hypothetical protein